MRLRSFFAVQRASRGFTLIEVLVALGIVATAIFAGSQATQALARSAQRQTDLLLAQICSENELTRVRLARQMPPVGDEKFDCIQAERRLIVTRQVRPTPNPSFMRVQVDIADGQTQYGILQMTTVVGRY